MPATCSTRGVLKASTNRVRTSTALQGSAMWENVIGIVNEERGSNAGVEALINAPQHGGGRKAAQERRARAAEAVLATGGFDTAIMDYDSLLALAKTQGAVGSANRGACKMCGQLGHLTKQCRNQFSKYYDDQPGAAAGTAAVPAGGALPGGAGGVAALSGGTESGLSSGSSSDNSSEDERRRKRKEKKRKREKRERKEKKERREKKRRKEKKDKKRSKSSSSDSD